METRNLLTLNNCWLTTLGPRMKYPVQMQPLLSATPALKGFKLRIKDSVATARPLSLLSSLTVKI